MEKKEEKNEGKVITMQPKQEAKQEKMSYEQLEMIAHQMHEQLVKAMNKINELNMANIFKRLDYLFKVLENQHMFKQEFVTKCVEEIQDILTVVPEEETEEVADDKEG